jgi:hypothetical protein
LIREFNASTGWDYLACDFLWRRCVDLQRRHAGPRVSRWSDRTDLTDAAGCAFGIPGDWDLVHRTHGRDPRTLIGLPIGGLMIWYLMTRKGAFQTARPSSGGS